MAREVRRSAAAVEAAVSFLGARTLPHQIAFDAVVDALGSRSVGNHSSVIVDSLVVAANRAAADAVDDAEARFAALVDARPAAKLRDEATWLSALRAAGWSLASLDDLSGFARRPEVAALRRLQRALELSRRCAGGELEALLRGVVDSVDEQRSLAEVVAELTLAGVDAERLSWAAITFETHNHIRLIWHQTNRMARNFPDCRPADLFAFGWMGLRVALRAYDPDRCAFSTYACVRIKGAIRDGVRSETPIPKRLTTYMRKVAAAEEDLTQALGRVPALAEVAEHMGEELESLRIIPRLAPAASIEEMVGDGERPEPSVLTGGLDPADMAVASARAEAIAEALGQLDDDDAEAMRLLYLEGCSVAEARQITGATARQLRQRCARARERLAVLLEDWATV